LEHLAGTVGNGRPAPVGRGHAHVPATVVINHHVHLLAVAPARAVQAGQHAVG
jgi:hypothetical protein